MADVKRKMNPELCTQVSRRRGDGEIGKENRKRERIKRKRQISVDRDENVEKRREISIEESEKGAQIQTYGDVVKI